MAPKRSRPGVEVDHDLENAKAEWMTVVTAGETRAIRQQRYNEFHVIKLIGKLEGYHIPMQIDTETTVRTLNKFGTVILPMLILPTCVTLSVDSKME